jgi:hypothetical protein
MRPDRRRSSACPIRIGYDSEIRKRHEGLPAPIRSVHELLRLNLSLAICYLLFGLKGHPGAPDTAASLQLILAEYR